MSTIYVEKPKPNLKFFPSSNFDFDLVANGSHEAYWRDARAQLKTSPTISRHVCTRTMLIARGNYTRVSSHRGFTSRKASRIKTTIFSTETLIG